MALFILATVVSSEGWYVSGFAEDKQQLNLTSKTQFRTASLGDTLVLPVNTLGKVRSFLLDTGSSFTNYDDSLKSQLKYVADGEVEGGPRFPIYETPGATIGKLSLGKEKVSGEGKGGKGKEKVGRGRWEGGKEPFTARSSVIPS